MCFSHFIFCFAGDIILHSEMALEELGGGKDSSPNDGLGRGDLSRNGEKTKKETSSRLFV